MIRFGTDGIRGLAGEVPVVPEVAVAVGRAATRWARDAGGDRVLVGRDPRPSGPWLEAAVAAGIAGEGGVARVVGVMPTSGLAAALAAGVADAAVMITASHNPAGDNGFKVLGPGARKPDDADAERLEGWIAAGPANAKPGHVEPAVDDAWDAYLDALVACTPPGGAFEGARLAVDLANGAATPLRGWLQERYGDVWTVVGGGGLPNDGVGSEHPAALQAAVRDERCDGGFAVDGDGDRCRLVDERGEIVAGDVLAWWLAKSRGASTLAVTVMSTTALEAALPAVRVVRTPVGDRHLHEAMEANALELGCEESGHVLFRDALPTGDGLVTGLRALAALLEAGKPVSGRLSAFSPYPRRLTRVRAPARRPLEDSARLADAIGRAQGRLGSHGRAFLRYSGTEPVLRILVEGPDEGVVDSVSAELTALATEELS